MPIKYGPAYEVGQGLYNFQHKRDQFARHLTRIGHPAEDIQFQAAGMTAMHILYKVRTAYHYGFGMSDEDYHKCGQALTDLLLEIYDMQKPEVAA